MATGNWVQEMCMNGNRMYVLLHNKQAINKSTPKVTKQIFYFNNQPAHASCTISMFWSYRQLKDSQNASF